MAKEKKPTSTAVTPVGEGTPPSVAPQAQPLQLDLFRLTDLGYTNAFDFYEMIPRFVVGGDKSRYYTPSGRIQEIRRNPDGTALPVERFYEHQGKGYGLEIKPALIKQKEGKYKAIFPGVREEIIETVLFKLAVEKGYFASYVNEEDSKPENFTLFTSLYEIQRELERQRGAVSYSKGEVREALEVLQEATFQLKSKDADTDLKFQLISDFGHFNKEYDENGKKATIYIRFNALISSAILKRNWRLLNYESVMKEESFLARWFRKRLSLMFIQAQLGKSYNIKLSTIINSSGISPSDEVRFNLAFVKKTLTELDIVERIHIEKEFEINPVTKRQLMKDALFVIYPTLAFANEQIRANQHAKKMGTALPGDDGKPIIDPNLQFGLSLREKEEMRRKYLKAQAVSQEAILPKPGHEPRK
jgi:hypothetical protein